MKRAAVCVLAPAWLLLACGGQPTPAGSAAAGLAEDAIPVPESARPPAKRADETHVFDLSPKRVYVNFDGGTITHGLLSDARLDVSFIGGGEVPAFTGTAAQREEVLDRVRGHFAAYHIDFVTERPTAGDYTMAMVGGEPADIGYAAPANGVGVAPMDCGDQLPRDIVFVFAGRLAEMVPSLILARESSETLAHELGHAFGLPHTTEPCDLMSYGSCWTKAFTDAELDLPEAERGTCGVDAINPHQHLRGVLGDHPDLPAPDSPLAPPTPTDDEPPTVQITAPSDGATVEGPIVTVAATAIDDVGLSAASFHVDGVPVGSSAVDGQPWIDFTAHLLLSPGERLVTFSAQDTAGNEGTAKVRITVTAPSDDPPLPEPDPAPPTPEPTPTEPTPTDPPAPDPAPAPEPTPEPAWGSCSYTGRAGVCQDVASACAGTYQSGLCPGPSAIRCCVSWGSCSYGGQQGSCQRTSQSCGGTYRSGLCPGPSDVRCCLP